MRIVNPFPYGDKTTIITVVDTGEKDEFNQPIVSTTTVTVKGSYSDTETVEGPNGIGQVVSRPHVILPAGTVIDSTSQVTVRGVTWQVDGRPEPLTNPYTGWNGGVRVNLTATAG